MIQVEVVPGGKLSADQVAAWSRLQEADGALASPFFRPEFARAVAATHHNVEVAVLKDGEETVGFFPYQRGRRNAARPVGGRFSDFQGIVLKHGAAMDPKALLRACGLSAWCFDHLITSQPMFRAYQWVTIESPYMDLSEGYEAYRIERRQAGSRTIKQTMQKARKIEREVGPLEFQPHAPDQQVLQLLLRWKRAQCWRVRRWQCIRDWPVPLLEHLLKLETQGLSGSLSVLRAGDRIAAIVFGIRSKGVLHLLVPAFDPVFAKYSPGVILLVKLAQAAPDLGIEQIHLGRGWDRYKSSLAGGTVMIADGRVDLRPGVGTIAHSRLRVRELIRASPFRVPVQDFVHRMRRLRSATPRGCRECIAEFGSPESNGRSELTQGKPL